MVNLELPITVPDNMPHLGTVKVWAHLSQVVLTLLTICTVAPVIATEIRFYSGSQAGPNWTLFVAIFTSWIPVLLVYFPWAYDRKNKFKRIGKFCLKPRTNLIFTGFGSLMWAAAGIAMAVHANNPDHCNIDSERAADDGDYASAWSAQCNCAKAAAGFAWITCLMWIATLICSVIIFWNEKQLIQKNLREHQQNKQEALAQQEQGEAMMENEAHPEDNVKYQVPSQQNTYYHPSPTPPPHAITEPYPVDYRTNTVTPPQQYLYPSNSATPSQYPQYHAETTPMPMAQRF
ncbi:hypothetical protein BJV82DRAFT_669149 [Fennellomyces sp. T-0311]|nr:hypothetical protein BJV82DRAFT_669149 [Fennellomyces sp. T-0311]